LTTDLSTGIVDNVSPLD